MSKVGTVAFTGQSGTEYGFDVYSVDTQFNDVSAVYAMSTRKNDSGTYKHSVNYIGESGELGTRLAEHEKWPCATTHGTNAICVHRINGDTARLKVEADLRARYNPPCNKQ
ncbi:MAG: hypothetical protein WBB85_02465 [Albidovulum sp.]|uniref:hypothetical protein n=1 Tax=Albidovulum sp. TaxID=1872424 RepID=UPI003C873328